MSNIEENCSSSSVHIEILNEQARQFSDNPQRPEDSYLNQNNSQFHNGPENFRQESQSYPLQRYSNNKNYVLPLEGGLFWYPNLSVVLKIMSSQESNKIRRIKLDQNEENIERQEDNQNDPKFDNLQIQNNIQNIIPNQQQQVSQDHNYLLLRRIIGQPNSIQKIDSQRIKIEQLIKKNSVGLEIIDQNKNTIQQGIQNILETYRMKKNTLGVFKKSVLRQFFTKLQDITRRENKESPLELFNINMKSKLKCSNADYNILFQSEYSEEYWKFHETQLQQYFKGQNTKKTQKLIGKILQQMYKDQPIQAKNLPRNEGLSFKTKELPYSENDIKNNMKHIRKIPY